MGSLRGFSWHGPTRLPFRPRPSGGPVPGACMRGICRPQALHTFRCVHQQLRAVPCVTPSVMTLSRGPGVLTRFPSATPLGLALGPDSPREDYPCPGTLGLTVCGFFTRIFAYSCQHSRFRYLQRASPRAFPGLRNALLPLLAESTTSVTRLVPIIFGAGSLDQ